MIGWFPNSYEDELIYSVFARYSNQSVELSVREVLKKFFNDYRAKLTPDFPSNLDLVVEQLSIFEYKDFEYFLYKHTPFYYFTNFLISNDKRLIVKEIKQKKTKNIQMLIGQVSSTVKETKYCKYCPSCFKNDLREYGESYWRISHQLPSVFICIVHHELLQFSSVLYRNKNSELLSPNENNCSPSPLTQCISTKISKEGISHLTNIAIKSKRLMNRELNINPLQVREIYKDMLRKKGLLTVNGRVRQVDLYKEFLLFYGIDVLNYFQSLPSLERQTCWLKTITRKHRISFHPVRHLLLMNFFGIEIDKAIVPTDDGPFGEGPFPCLNPAAEHYKELVITDINIKRCTDTGRPLGVFDCSCGFKYTRIGPDPLKEDMFRYRFVRNFGNVWMEKIFEYIDKEHLSYRRTAQLLQVDVGTVIKYYKKAKTGHQNIEKYTDVKEYRKSWLFVKEENQTLSKTELRKLNPKVYIWLYRHDKEWLNNNSPAQIKKINLTSRVDWNERDLEILELIKSNLNTIDNNARPVRLTKRGIGVIIGKLALIEKKLDEMPLTKEFIKSVVESKSQYQERLNAWKINNSI